MSKKIQDSRSHRFILSFTGLAFITLALAITAQNSSANISGITRARAAPAKYISHTKTHTLFPTGDVDFDYAANMRMHHQIAVEMSQAQIKNGKDKQLRNMAMHIIAEHNNEIAKLDRWMAMHADSKPDALLSTR
ncbi:MAG: DUF305 domain-containing protein [Arenimonas sp.]